MWGTEKIELSQRKLVAGTNRTSKDPELIDEGKQPKFTRLLERVRPPTSVVSPRDGHFGNEDVVKIRGGGNVPGAANQGTYNEVVIVVPEVEKDNFNDLLRKSGGQGLDFCNRPLRSTR